MPTLIELEEPFKSMWRKGYLQTHPNGRKYVCLYNSNSERSLISYARYVVSVRNGEILPEGFEVDHINNDKSDDSDSNLVLISQKDNIRKQALLSRGFIQKDQIQECSVCSSKFTHVKVRQTCGNRGCLNTLRSQITRDHHTRNGKQ